MENKKRVMYVVEDIESAQYRYRVKNVMEVLDDSSSWQASWVLSSRLSDIDLGSVDLVVILRQTGRRGKLSRFVKKLHKREIKVLFDLDDLIFDCKDLPILMKSTNSKNIVYWIGYVLGIRRIAKRVDGFVTTNDFLAKKLKRSFSRPTVVIPNSLNKEQVELSEKLIKEKKSEGGFVIGYFSGSPTHKKDLELVEPELIKFLDERDDAKLKIVGYMELSENMKRLVEGNKIELERPVDYLKLEKMISEVDVNIAPLVYNDFTNCKSELKFFEAAIVEITTIASPTYAFKKAISDGENGFLAQPGEWYDKLKHLYKNPSKNQKIAKKAREYALEHYYGKEFLEEVEAAYDHFVV